MKTMFPASLIALAVIVTQDALAQSNGVFAITASVIAGGGGRSTGGAFAVTGTLGQPLVGQANGGNFSMQSGFWGVVQTPGAPLLRITRTTVNGAIISWPNIPVTGWVLQETMALGAAASWKDVTSPAVVPLNGQNTVTFKDTTGVRYFRLRHP